MVAEKEGAKGCRMCCTRSKALPSSPAHAVTLLKSLLRSMTSEIITPPPCKRIPAMYPAELFHTSEATIASPTALSCERTVSLVAAAYWFPKYKREKVDSAEKKIVTAMKVNRVAKKTVTGLIR